VLVRHRSVGSVLGAQRLEAIRIVEEDE
jgi:hypothetical protein